MLNKHTLTQRMNEYKEATEEFQDGEVTHFTYESYILTLISSVYDYPDP